MLHAIKFIGYAWAPRGPWAYVVLAGASGISGPFFGQTLESPHYGHGFWMLLVHWQTEKHRQ